jgi:hypothetical protein
MLESNGAIGQQYSSLQTWSPSKERDSEVFRGLLCSVHNETHATNAHKKQIGSSTAIDFLSVVFGESICLTINQRSEK